MKHIMTPVNGIYEPWMCLNCKEFLTKALWKDECPVEEPEDDIPPIWPWMIGK